MQKAMSSFRPFARPKHCAVVDKVVMLSGIEVTLGDHPEIMGKFCSNCGNCMAEFGRLDGVDDCLLHGLAPADIAEPPTESND